jgi:hypothetical protein
MAGNLVADDARLNLRLRGGVLASQDSCKAISSADLAALYESSINSALGRLRMGAVSRAEVRDDGHRDRDQGDPMEVADRASDVLRHRR